MGYCIICGKIIPKDINKPFCKSCYAPYQEVAISSWISGRCCHYCRNEKEKISNHYPLCNECKPFSRHDNSINDSFLQNINEFKNMSLSDRQNIEPLWLSQESKICNNSKYNIVLHELNISEIIKIIETTSNLNTANIFENEPKDNRRIMNILRAWKQKKKYSPSYCCL